MIEISLNKIKKSYGNNKILNDITFELNTGDIVSLVGDNGCGKSTLLKIINGIEKQDRGICSIRKGSVIGYLDQTIDEEKYNKTVNDILYEKINNILCLEKQMSKLEDKMKNDPNNIVIINKYLNVQEQYMKLGGYEINSTIDKITHGFNIYHLLNNNFIDLSGGEQKRVLLAAIMIQKPDILLLDEPTNHLDIITLEWFEDFLSKYNGTVLIVSHDRYFLDKVSNKTILIENGKTIVFNGNYSYYLEENNRRIDREFKDYKDQQKIVMSMKKKIKQLEEFGKLAYPGGEPFFRRAENIRKRLERLELKEKPIEKKSIPLELNDNNRSGKDALIINNYDLCIAGKALIKNINFSIHYGDKVCIIGNNGCGKSSLIKKIINNNSDNIKLGSNIVISYIPQNITFDSNYTILEYAKKFYCGEESHLRSALNKFYFHGEAVFKKVNSLSGGEKVRIKLFELMQSKSNFIIMDEPTNHIDIFTKEILENALKDYNGTLLFVSHDRFFINKIANKILYINDNIIKEYIGNYDDLKRHI